MSDGARTRDNRDHNPVLYQLSYTHHGAAESIAGAGQASDSIPVSAAATAAASTEVGPGWATKTVER